MSVRFDGERRFASRTGFCETPSGISEHASVAARFLSQRDSCSTLFPSSCSRISEIRVRAVVSLIAGNKTCGTS